MREGMEHAMMPQGPEEPPAQEQAAAVEVDEEVGELRDLAAELALAVEAGGHISPEAREQLAMVGAEAHDTDGVLNRFGKGVRRVIGTGLLALSAMGVGAAMPKPAEAQPTSEATKVIAIIGGVVGVLGRGAQEVEREREKTRQKQVEEAAKNEREREKTRQKQVEEAAKNERERIKAEAEQRKFVRDVEIAKIQSGGKLEEQKLKLEEKLAHTTNDREKARIGKELRVITEALRVKEKERTVEFTSRGETETVRVSPRVAEPKAERPSGPQTPVKPPPSVDLGEP